MITPGAVEIAPAVIRLCPKPFDERVFSRNSVVSNLTGREVVKLLFDLCVHLGKHLMA
jgi:hypothetical protein